MSIRIVSGDDWGPDPAHRKNDTNAARQGAKEAAMRANSQKAKLLVAHYQAGVPLNPDEAGELAGLPIHKTSHWKRIGELETAGYLFPTGGERKSERTQTNQSLHMINDEGRIKARQLLKEH